MTEAGLKRSIRTVIFGKTGLFVWYGYMGTYQQKTVSIVVLLVISSFIGGCGEEARKELTPALDMGTTIGSLTEVFALETIPVEGYGLVGGLKRTGSAECPPQIRAYLTKYIVAQLPDRKINVGKLISSRNTAVVRVYGIMPAAISRDQHFDVRVIALEGTQTTSLAGGWLYSAELRAASGLGTVTRVLARAEGPIFTDTIGPSGKDKRAGYVLGGGGVLDEYKIILALRPDYRVASIIRDRLNERFGSGTAKAVSPGQIDLRVPARYSGRKERFISIVRATYLSETGELTKERVRRFVTDLGVSQDKYASEIALEAIGNESLEKLAILLKLSNEEVRLRAARCMLNLGSDGGLGTLREIALDKGSANRIGALEAITAGASRNDAAAISRRLLRDDDFDVRLAAYEQLRKLDDVAVRRKFIGRNFHLEQIAQAKHKAVFVSRSGRPRIVLFGAPIYMRDNIFIQSGDGGITIDARAGQKHVSLMRKHPRRPTVIGPLESSFRIADIIQTLCGELPTKADEELVGLGVSYAEVIALLKQMCDGGAVEAEFRAGPLPKID